MKKVLIGLVVFIVVLAGGVLLVFSNLNGFVKTAIETAGTNSVGSQVQVESVEINLSDGTASIFGFSIANPQGFSNATMVSFEELSVSIDVESITSDVIRINSIIARNPFVLYESADGSSNVDTVSARFEGDDSTQEVDDSAEGPVIAIESILIESIQASLVADLLPNTLDVNLGDIALMNLMGTPDEIAEQIMGPVTTQLSSAAASVVVQAVADLLTDGIGALGDQLGNVGGELEEVGSELLDSVGDATEGLREGLGNLFGGDDD